MYYSSEIGAFIKEIDDKILQYSTALQGNLTLNEDCSHDFQSWCQMHNLMPGYAYSAFKYGEFHPIIQNLSIFKIRCWLVSRIIFEANNVCNEIGKEWQNQGITLKFWLNKILSSIARYLNDPLLTQGFVQPNYEHEDMDDFTNYMQPDYPTSESTSTMDIIMGSEPIADMDELSVCRFTIMIKLSLMYLRLLETMPRNISENLANYQQGLQEHEVTAIMSDIEVMPRLIEELLPKIDELYMEMLDVYDLKSHEEIWIKLKQWKRNTRNIESASALFSLKPVMQELIEIKNSMINRLRYDADIMQIADETINMLQVFQNRLLPVQDLINKISMIRIEICDLHNNLLSKSFFVIIHCYRAPKSNGNIKCHLVYLAQPYLPINIDTFNVEYIGFRDNKDSDLRKNMSDASKCYDLFCFEARARLHNTERVYSRGEYVTDYRYQLEFSLASADPNAFKFTCRTIPFFIRTGNAQCWKALCTLAWDYFFMGDVDETKIENFPIHQKASWDEIECMLQSNFRDRLGRELTSENIQYLRHWIMQSNRNGGSISWDDFHYGFRIGNSKHTVGEWIFACLETLAKPENSLKELWRSGHIIGFICKNEANRILDNELKGVCLVRFSEQKPGAITIPYTNSSGAIAWPHPIKCSESNFTWIDTLHLYPGFAKVLYPGYLNVHGLDQYRYVPRPTARPDIIDGYEDDCPLLRA